MQRVAAACAVLLLVPAISLGAVQMPRPIAPRPKATFSERTTIRLLNVKDRITARVKGFEAKLQAKWPKWLPRDKTAVAGKWAKTFGWGMAAGGIITWNPMLVTGGMALATMGRAAHRLALPNEKQEENWFTRKFAVGGKLAVFGMRLFGGVTRRAGLAGLVGGGLMMNPWIAGAGIAIQVAGGVVRALNHRLELKRAGLLGPAEPEAPRLVAEPEPEPEPEPRAQFVKRLAEG